MAVNLLAADDGISAFAHNLIPHVLIFQDTFAVEIGFLTVSNEPFEQRILRHAAAAAMFEFEITVGNLPAVVLATYQIFHRHPDVIEEHGIFDAHHQLQMLNRDTRQIGGYVKPAEVLMALSRGIGANKGPEKIRRQVMADHDLLAIDDEVVAVTNRFGLAVGNIAAALWLG